MEITMDESKPEDSVDRFAMNTICTGEEAVDIPPHWHKVSKIVVKQRGIYAEHV